MCVTMCVQVVVAVLGSVSSYLEHEYDLINPGNSTNGTSGGSGAHHRRLGGAVSNWGHACQADERCYMETRATMQFALLFCSVFLATVLLFIGYFKMGTARMAAEPSRVVVTFSRNTIASKQSRGRRPAVSDPLWSLGCVAVSGERSTNKFECRRPR